MNFYLMWDVMYIVFPQGENKLCDIYLEGIAYFELIKYH